MALIFNPCLSPATLHPFTCWHSFMLVRENGGGGNGVARWQQSLPRNSSLHAVCVWVCLCWEHMMSGDTSTLSWRSMSPTSQSDSSELSPTTHATREGILPVKIIKVCFLSNSSNLGKNFKLVRCEESWTIRVSHTTRLPCTTLLVVILYFTVMFTVPHCCFLQ